MATFTLGAAGPAAMSGRAGRRWRAQLSAIVLASALALFYFAAGAYLWLEQRDMIFEPAHGAERTPAMLGLAAQEHWIPVGGGAGAGLLHSWWIAGPAADAPTLLFLHGSDCNVGNELDHAARLRAIGFNVLLIDYRGFGQSTGGQPSESKVYEDAEAAWNFLNSEKRLRPAQVVLYGHSLGGAIAIDLATRHADAQALIVESTFTSMSEMAGLRHYGIFPVDLVLNQRFNSIAKVGKLQLPVLFLHGTSDEIIPYRMSEQLFESVRAPKALQLIPGGDHEHDDLAAPKLYGAAIHNFLAFTPGISSDFHI